MFLLGRCRSRLLVDVCGRLPEASLGSEALPLLLVWHRSASFRWVGQNRPQRFFERLMLRFSLYFSQAERFCEPLGQAGQCSPHPPLAVVALPVFQALGYRLPWRRNDQAPAHLLMERSSGAYRSIGCGGAQGFASDGAHRFQWGQTLSNRCSRSQELITCW